MRVDMRTARHVTQLSNDTLPFHRVNRQRRDDPKSEVKSKNLYVLKITHMDYPVTKLFKVSLASSLRSKDLI